MAYREKKDLRIDNFYKFNELLGKQVTEVCDAKQDVYNSKIIEGNSEFPDGYVYDTYNSLQGIFQNMYDSNVDNEINLDKKRGALYLDEERCTNELNEVVESMINYSKELIYRFGDLGNTGSVGAVSYVDSLASYIFKRKLSREEFERYEVLLDKTSTGDPVTGLTDEEKLEFIELYEKLYPVDKQNMSGICSIFENDGYSGYEIDVMNIKILAYTAEEPYKSIYIDNISRVTEGDLHYIGTSKSSEGKFFIDVSGWMGNKSGTTYKIFFHETAHSIDYLLGNENSYTPEYRDANGNSLNNILEAEVRKRINNAIDDYFKTKPNWTEEEKTAIRKYVEDSIMNQVDYLKYKKPDFSRIVGEDSIVNSAYVGDCYRKVRENINAQIIGFAADNYGGLTGNTLKPKNLGWHEAIIKKDGDKTEYRVYWVSGGIKSDGTDLYITLDNDDEFKETIDLTDDTQWKNSDLDERVIMSEGEVIYTDKISKEFFAEGMAANLARDENELKTYEFYYPETIDYFENMLETMN